MSRRRPRRGGFRAGTLGLIGLLALVMVAAGGFFWASARQGEHIGGPFALRDAAGHRVTQRTYRGRYMLVYFGYTHCPDMCPATLAAIAAALRQIGPKAARIVPIFISVDPARDTPAIAERFAQRFSARFVGLSGSPAAIARVAAAYHVYFRRLAQGTGTMAYSMDHSAMIYLMGPDGKFIAPVEAGASPAEIAATLSRLVS